MALLLNCLMIFFVRIIDVSLGTLSTVLVIRNKRILGSLIGFIDIIVWFLVVRQALTINDATFLVAMAYAGGYGVGTYVGSYVEEKLALGDVSIQVITRGLRYDVVDIVRDNGFAVSTIICEGIENKNLLLIIEVTRKRIMEVRKILRKVAPDSFVSISDVQQIFNGYMK